MLRNTKWLAAALCLAVFAAMALGSGQTDSGEIKQVVSNEGSETAGADEST